MASSTAHQEERQLVAFKMAGETYAIPIILVHEIIRPCAITEIPCCPDYVLGVVNLRGKIVPVIDLRRRLDLPAAEAAGSTRIIVAEAEGGVVGMMVDAVSQVIRIPESDIELPSDLVANVQTDLILGVGKTPDGLVILLDIPKALCLDTGSHASVAPLGSVAA